MALPPGQHNRPTRSGFTLIEVLIVVAILGLLSTIALVKTVHYIDEARKRATCLQITELRTAIDAFRITLGRHPKELAELVIEGDEDWPGPFIDAEEVPRDAWGNEFRYQRTPKRIHVRSAGEDGVFDTDDDLP